ncbi:MAG: YajQ family cyclic di-GMP-binding protein [Gammaproteobacteria bacterium]|nr:YajQ family cyclic di-GMP-binding protein [Gammaproteobacteria bacterium]
MPSFDIVSEVDQHELKNAVDQANREITGRFDFKGSDSKIKQAEDVLNIESASKFQIRQIHEILFNKLSKRGLDLRCLNLGDIDERGNRAYQAAKIQAGIESDSARKIIKLIKEAKIKVQAAIQGEQVRVTGKSRDDLQKVISLLKNSDIDLPLQYQNFRD